MTIYEKLGAVQQALKAPKGQFNSFGNYKYRSCEDVLEAVKPLLSQNKLVLLLKDDVVEIGGRVYVKAIAEAVDIETADHIGVTALAREEETKKGMDSSQITGAASSYARKYALNGLFCIDDTKDSDFTNHASKDEPAAPKAKPAPKPAPAPAADGLICSDCGVSITDNVARYSRDFYGRPLCRTCQRKADKTI